MSEIYQLIELLSTREHHSFIKYLDQRNKRKQAKNIALFKAFLKGKEGLIKAKVGENAFNVAKKRLSDNLLDFIASRTLETEATIESRIIKLLVIARKLFHYQNSSLAFKILSKAKKEAESIGHYILLNEIYHLFIQYSHTNSLIDQQKLFLEFEENARLLLDSEKRNMAIARLKRSFQNLNTGDNSIEDLLVEYQQSVEAITLSSFQFKDLLQLAEIVDSIGLYRKNYFMVNLFFIERLRELQGSESDNEFQLVYHLELLYLIANIYFRKKDFQESMSFLLEMETQMKRYESKYYNRFYIQYATLFALNLNFSQQHQKARELLEAIVNSSAHSNRELLNPILSLIMIYFQQEELKDAVRLFARLQESDQTYLQAKGVEWVLNKKYMEILLHIELENYDLADAKIKSLLRSHASYFKEQNNEQIIPFLKLVKEVYNHPKRASQQAFKDKIEASIPWKEKKEEDLFYMCFYAWLKAKVEKRPLYETTLELMQ